MPIDFVVYSLFNNRKCLASVTLVERKYLYNDEAVHNNLNSLAEVLSLVYYSRTLVAYKI